MVRAGAKAEQTHYILSEVPTDWGRGFLVRKFVVEGGEEYQVHLDAQMGDSCTCLGHLRWSHRGTVCRHVGALKALIAAGRL